MVIDQPIMGVRRLRMEQASANAVRTRPTHRTEMEGGVAAGETRQATLQVPTEGPRTLKDVVMDVQLVQARTPHIGTEDDIGFMDMRNIGSVRGFKGCTVLMGHAAQAPIGTGSMSVKRIVVIAYPVLATSGDMVLPRGAAPGLRTSSWLGVALTVLSSCLLILMMVVRGGREMGGAPIIRPRCDLAPLGAANVEVMSGNTPIIPGLVAVDAHTVTSRRNHVKVLRKVVACSRALVSNG